MAYVHDEISRTEWPFSLLGKFPMVCCSESLLVTKRKQETELQRLLDFDPADADLEEGDWSLSWLSGPKSNSLYHLDLPLL